MIRTICVEEDGVRRDVDIYTEEGFQVLSSLWARSGWSQRTYHEITWLGVPIWQLPQDMVMMQELIWKLRPDVILETGLALGGSAIFYASLLEVIGHGHVISVELNVQKPVRATVAAHPLGKRTTQLQGSSIDDDVIARVKGMIEPEARVLVVLDSNHTRAHVRQELEKYAAFVGADGYVVVFDGNMETLADAADGKPEWIEDNPAAATRDFLADHPEFEIDPHYNRLGATYCPGGFLRRRGEGPSELARQTGAAQEAAVRAAARQFEGPKARLERSLIEERQRHEDAEKRLREDVAALRSKLDQIYRSPTWRAGRVVSRLAQPLRRSTRRP